MKKSIFAMMFLMLILFSVNSLSINELKIDTSNHYRDIYSFKVIYFYENNKVEFTDEVNLNSSKLWNQIFDYSISVDGKFYEIAIKKKEYSEKFLMLISDEYLVLYSESDTPIFFGVSKTNAAEALSFPSSFKASSELKENNIIFSANNLKTLDSWKPWVEAAIGYGEGETIEFGMNGTQLIIFNGFVSRNKRYLFSQNSRVKTIDLYFKSSNIHKRYELQDTPNPQAIKLGALFNDEVILTIVEVYKGDKYSDTCLNAIMVRYY